MEELARQADQVPGLHQHRVHLAVDADAAVARAPARLLGEPVLAVAHPQRFDQGRPVHVQLVVGQHRRLLVQTH